jgi:hypothetical protein
MNTTKSIEGSNKTDTIAKSTRSVNFWNITFSDILSSVGDTLSNLNPETISLILGIFALIVSIPNAIIFFVGHFYKPKIEAFFAPSFQFEKNAKIIWSQLNNTLIQVRNNTSRNLLIEIEVITEKPWQHNPDASALILYSGLKGGYPLKGAFWVKTKVLDIPGNSGNGFTFPLIPQQENNLLEIIIHPRIKLSEFKFPTFYGEVYLNPIKEKFTITL